MPPKKKATNKPVMDAAGSAEKDHSDLWKPQAPPWRQTSLPTLGHDGAPLDMKNRNALLNICTLQNDTEEFFKYTLYPDQLQLPEWMDPGTKKFVQAPLIRTNVADSEFAASFTAQGWQSDQHMYVVPILSDAEIVEFNEGRTDFLHKLAEDMKNKAFRDKVAYRVFVCVTHLCPPCSASSGSATAPRGGPCAWPTTSNPWPSCWFPISHSGLPTNWPRRPTTRRTTPTRQGIMACCVLCGV